jgi:hypothetical protein
MRRIYIVLAVLVALVTGRVIYLVGGSGTPAGQPPLVKLTSQNLAEIRDSFNAAKDQVRVLTLLSPT